VFRRFLWLRFNQQCPWNGTWKRTYKRKKKIFIKWKI